MLLCDSLQTVLTVRHVPGNHNLIANALSRFRVPVNTEWESHPAIFLQAITGPLSRQDEAVLHTIIVGDLGTKIALAKPEL
jgi:hypothetical protein